MPEGLNPSQSEIPVAMDHALAMGGAALQGNRRGLIQYLAIEQSGDATLFSVPYSFSLRHRSYFDSKPTVSRGLELSGVMRKDGFLKRHFVDCGPAEIEEGDKAVLVDTEGNRTTTLKLQSLMGS